MEDLDKIAEFLRKHHVMTLATVGADGQSWCAHVFYAWMAQDKRFVFMTDPATRHGNEMTTHTKVAAGIALETRIVGRLQGLQIEGEAYQPEGGDLEKARHVYLKRFPYAVAMGLPLWILAPDMMKLTDNTLGFGKKLIWAGTPTADPVAE